MLSFGILCFDFDLSGKQELDTAKKNSLQQTMKEQLQFGSPKTTFKSVLFVSVANEYCFVSLVLCVCGFIRSLVRLFAGLLRQR